MSPQLAARETVVLDDVVAAVAVLRDPSGPGEPWSAEDIALALPALLDLADGGSLAVAADTARWLDAADAGLLPAD
ncbi:hypothetical protein [Streptomyces sp. SBT349]|uniref:hypothetical protein n=1 Tax=Streptomyces sp. SBT349 TaxID=1580539 RepID=UPI00066E270E|nr:hypothetical protein [Streptomyces sp. SBT349]